MRHDVALTGLKILCPLALAIASSATNAGIFRLDDLFGNKSLGELRGIYDLDLAYGARYRVDDRDPALIAIVSNGSNPQDSLLDDGNLNYDQRSLVSNMVRGTGELTLQMGHFGIFARGYAFYDFENAHNDRARTPLSDRAEDQVARDYGILDAYLSVIFSAGKFPIQIRAGDQVVSWGETTFFSPTGVNVINPLNIPLAQQPTATARDLRLPVGLVWGTVSLSPLVSIEAFYQYEWEPTVIPAKGTYLAGGDLIPGVSSAQFTGTASDLGTDSCERFGLDPGRDNFQSTSGTDPTKIKALQPPPTSVQGGDGCFDFMYLKGVIDQKSLEPKDGGQYGLKLQTIVPRWNDTKLAFYYANYHSRLPYMSGYSASQESLAASLSNTAFNIGNGLLGPANAVELAFANITKEMSLVFEYPEDIQMFGASFNTTTIRTGTALSGEIAHHRGYPFQLHVGQVVPALLNLVPPGHPGKEFSPPYESASFLRSWIELDKTQTTLAVTQLFGPRLGASQVAMTLAVAQLHIHDMPNKDEVRLQTPGVALLQYSPEKVFADANSWGYRFAGVLTYNNELGAFTISPRLIFSHDVDGNSPGGQPFQEEKKSLSLGVKFNYIDRVSADFSYTSFFGAGQYNVLNDRDYLNFNLRYSF